MKLCSEIIFAAASLMPHAQNGINEQENVFPFWRVRDVRNIVDCVECEEGAVICHSISKLNNLFCFSADECRVEITYFIPCSKDQIRELG
jgi:Na+-translocating ferredoxin:NAD+ oxidoreductase RnfC subunit